MKSALKYFPVIVSIFLLSCGTAPKENTPPPLIYFNPASVSSSPKITPGCEIPSLSGPRKDYFRPEFPIDQARKGNSGFVVLDFRINRDGRAEDIEVIANAPNTFFDGNSIKGLNKLNFTVDDKWIAACHNQTYRFAYLYALNMACNPKAFPSDMTVICVTGIYEKLR